MVSAGAALLCARALAAAARRGPRKRYTVAGSSHDEKCRTPIAPLQHCGPLLRGLRRQARAQGCALHRRATSGRRADEQSCRARPSTFRPLAKDLLWLALRARTLVRPADHDPRAFAAASEPTHLSIPRRFMSGAFDWALGPVAAADPVNGYCRQRQNGPNRRPWVAYPRRGCAPSARRSRPQGLRRLLGVSP